MGVGRGRHAIAVIAIALALSASAAHAGVDWAKGHVTATGIGVANRAAPTPAAARGPARRMAEDAARRQLAAALPALPLAPGGTLKDKLGDAKVKARFERAVAAALTVAAELETDGSWKVTMAVPIEAIRQVLVGPRTLGSEEGPAIVVVEGAKAKPAVGWKLGALAAPTIFVKAVPAWARKAPRVKARSAKAGVIELAAGKGSESTLFVIIRAAR